MCLAQGPQRSGASEARTCGPSVSSQALYHWATALRSLTMDFPQRLVQDIEPLCIIILCILLNHKTRFTDSWYVLTGKLLLVNIYLNKYKIVVTLFGAGSQNLVTLIFTKTTFCNAGIPKAWLTFCQILVALDQGSYASGNCQGNFNFFKVREFYVVSGKNACFQKCQGNVREF